MTLTTVSSNPGRCAPVMLLLAAPVQAAEMTTAAAVAVVALHTTIGTCPALQVVAQVAAWGDWVPVLLAGMAGLAVAAVAVAAVAVAVAVRTRRQVVGQARPG